jgi:hypothetical protein
VDSALGGLNLYQANLPRVQNGATFQVEISVDDMDLVPYIIFLMGASHNTFNINMGAAVAGNEKNPHHHEHRNRAVPYDIYIRDSQQPVPAVIWNNCALPGLAQGAAVNNDAVGAFDQAKLRRAMMAICDSAPVGDDAEAAWISNSVGLYSEYYRGVGDANVCGADDMNYGYDGMLRGGTVLIPSGNCVCNLFTVLTKDCTATLGCRNQVGKLLDLSVDIESIRKSTEPFILAFQHAARQVGVTVPVMFPSMPVGGVIRPGVALPANVDAENATAYDNLTTSGLDSPSPMLFMLHLVMARFYNVRLPSTFMFYGFGDNRANAMPPFLSNGDNGANRGECFTSVHPAQLATGVFHQSCVGMVGIPVNIEEQVAEMQFGSVGGGATYVVRGEDGSMERADHVVELDCGVGMIGHAVVLRRDDNVAGLGHYRIAFSSPRVEGETNASIDIEFEDFPRYSRRAFVPIVANDQDGWDVAGMIHYDHMELISDFEVHSAKSLQLGLVSVDGAQTLVQNQVWRSQLPGYVAIAIAAGVPTGPVGAIGMLRYPKRRRFTIAGGEPEKDGGGGDSNSRERAGDAKLK